MGSRYYIDIPDVNRKEGGWVNIADFSSKLEALSYVKKMFGADDKGRVSLISEVEEEDSEENSHTLDDDESGVGC